MLNVPIKVSEATAARRRVSLWLVDATDGITSETGITGQVYISKNGGASALTAASLTEVDSTNMPGLYYIELSAAEVNTVGPLFLSFKTAAVAQWSDTVQVVSYDPYDAVSLGLSAVNSAVVSMGASVVTAAALAADATTEIAGGVWDEATSAHTADGSYGVALKPLRVNSVASSGAFSITLDGSASSTTDLYKNCIVAIISGGAAGQARRITAYNGSSKEATVDTDWATPPIGGDGFAILPSAPTALLTGSVDANALATDAVTEIVNAVWAKALETGFTADRILRIVASAVAGKVSGGPGSPVFRNLQDNADVITGTADANGNRTAATYGA